MQKYLTAEVRGLKAAGLRLGEKGYYIISIHILPIFLHQLVLVLTYRKVIPKKIQAFSRRNQGSQFSPAITQSYHSSQKLGSVWIESLGLLSFLLEVKIDMGMVILKTNTRVVLIASKCTTILFQTSSHWLSSFEDCTIHLISYNCKAGASLMVQWLRLHASNAERGLGFNPWSVNKDPHTIGPARKQQQQNFKADVISWIWASHHLLALYIWCSHFPLTCLHHCDFLACPLSLELQDAPISSPVFTAPVRGSVISFAFQGGLVPFYWRIWMYFTTSGCKVWQIVFFI